MKDRLKEVVLVGSLMELPRDVGQMETAVELREHVFPVASKDNQERLQRRGHMTAAADS